LYCYIHEDDDRKPCRLEDALSYEEDSPREMKTR